MPSISVIVPVYNVEPYIEASIASIMGQTQTDIEIILLDDGSTDRSGELCDMLSARDSRIVVVHKQNEGIGPTRNLGLSMAKGRYVYFCDPDDLLSPALLADNLQLAERAGADIVVFGHTTKNSLTAETTLATLLPPISGVFSREQHAAYFLPLMHYSLTVWTRLYRREFLIRNNLIFNNQAIGEDAVFNLLVLGAPFRAIALNQSAYYAHILRPGSAMTKYRPQIYDCEYNVAHQLEVVATALDQERYKDLIDYFYVRALSISLGVMAEASCPLTPQQQLAYLQEKLQDAALARSVKRVKLRHFSPRSQQLKILLLKCGFYRTVLRLGRYKKQSRRKLS